jgi:hypothetical protein
MPTFVLRPPRDHGDKHFYKIYRTAETVQALEHINALDTPPTNLPKAAFRAELVENSCRLVSVEGQNRSYVMCVYEVEGIIR